MALCLLVPAINLLFLRFSSRRFSIVPMAEQAPRLLAALMKAQEDPDHKVIVFFVAARVVQASQGRGGEGAVFVTLQ